MSLTGTQTPMSGIMSPKGQTRVTLFAPDKRLAVADLAAGDRAYIPRGCGHTVQNVGTEECEVVGALDGGSYQETNTV